MMFMFFSKKCNWIDYQLLDVVTVKYGSDEDKRAMTSYINNELWQRSLCEILPESVGCHSFSADEYHFALPSISGQQLEQMKLLVAEKFHVPLEHIHTELPVGSNTVHFVVDKKLFTNDSKLFDDFVKSDQPNTYIINTDWIKSIKYNYNVNVLLNF